MCNEPGETRTTTLTTFRIDNTMDQFQDDSGSDRDSISLDIQQGGSVVLYGCNDSKLSSPANHVTKVLIGQSDALPTMTDNTIFPDDRPIDMESSGVISHALISPFATTDQYDVSQTAGKSVKQLAQAYLAVQQAKEEALQNSVSPSLSRRFRNSARSEVPSTKNPFLADPDTSNGIECSSVACPTVTTVNANISKISDEPCDTGAPPSPHPVAPGPPSTSDNPVGFPGAPPDLLGAATDSKTPPAIICPCSSTATQELNPAATTSLTTPAEKKSPDPINITPSPISESTAIQNDAGRIPPDVTLGSQTLLSSAEPVTRNIPEHTVQDTPEPVRIQILNAACQELPPIQETLNTPFQSPESSFHFPEPPRPAPLVCVPVKEVKFEEPLKHEVVTSQNATQELGEIVPITVQPSHTVQNHVAKEDEPIFQTCTTAQSVSKTKDESPSPQVPSDQEHSAISEAKLINRREQEVEEVEAPSDQTHEDQHEHSYGIIGNEDNMSEITLPPLGEGSANHRDQESGPYNNGHLRHRIRISIDHQAATPSRKTMAITVLLVILLFTTIALLAAYKFLHKSPPD